MNNDLGTRGGLWRLAKKFGWLFPISEKEESHPLLDGIWIKVLFFSQFWMKEECRCFITGLGKNMFRV